MNAPGGHQPSDEANQLGLCLPVGCCHPHPPLPFVIITQPKSRYSFCCPTEVGRLSSILSRVKFGRNLTPLQFVCKKGEHRINITDYLFVCVTEYTSMKRKIIHSWPCGKFKHQSLDC